MTDLPKRLRIKAGMIQLGERIAWGSDAEIMEEAADEIERINESLRVEFSALRQQEVEIHEFREERDTIRKQLSEARELLIRYRSEVPLGHQPHMAAHKVDEWLEQTK
jgi:chromosome segregation ATPase